MVKETPLPCEMPISPQEASGLMFCLMHDQDNWSLSNHDELMRFFDYIGSITSAGVDYNKLKQITTMEELKELHDIAWDLFREVGYYSTKDGNMAGPVGQLAKKFTSPILRKLLRKLDEIISKHKQQKILIVLETLQSNILRAISLRTTLNRKT